MLLLLLAILGHSHSGTALSNTCGSDDMVLVSDSTSGTTWRALPDCDGDTTVLHYDQATNTFTCGDDDTSAGGTPKAVISGESSASLTADAYCAPMGYDVCGTSATAVLDQRPVPYGGTIKNLYVWMSAAQASGDTCDIYIRSGTCNSTLVNTAVTCSILNVDQDCSDTVNTATVTAGQCIQIFFDEVLGTCAGNLIWSFEVDPT